MNHFIFNLTKHRSRRTIRCGSKRDFDAGSIRGIIINKTKQYSTVEKENDKQQSTCSKQIGEV